VVIPTVDMAYPVKSTVAYAAVALATDYWVLAMHRLPEAVPTLAWAGNGLFFAVAFGPAGILVSAALGLIFGLAAATAAKLLFARFRAEWLAAICSGRHDAEFLLLVAWFAVAGVAYHVGDALLWKGISGYVAAMNVFLARILIYRDLQEGYAYAASVECQRARTGAAAIGAAK
jgi:hypothetical protein